MNYRDGYAAGIIGGIVIASSNHAGGSGKNREICGQIIVHRDRVADRNCCAGRSGKRIKTPVVNIADNWIGRLAERRNRQKRRNAVHYININGRVGPGIANVELQVENIADAQRIDRGGFGHRQIVNIHGCRCCISSRGWTTAIQIIRDRKIHHASGIIRAGFIAAGRRGGMRHHVKIVGKIG